MIILIIFIVFGFIFYIINSIKNKNRQKEWEEYLAKEEEHKKQRREYWRNVIANEKNNGQLDEKRDPILLILMEKFDAPITKIVNYSKNNYVLISEEKGLIMINEKIYPFKDIIDYSLLDNSIKISTPSTYITKLI